MKLTETITVENLDVKVAPDLHTRLRWKEYQILSLLVENSPKAVTRGEFVNQIWKGTYCSDSTINQTIKSICKKIGDKEHEIIKTVPRVGYIIEEKHRFNIHSNPPYTLPVHGADTGVDHREQPPRAEQALAVQPAAQSVPRVIDELYIDPSDHAEPVWALPAHAKTPADLYQDAYPDKSLQ
uniref:OmpR/PhoB-type domain-containing protein n=1 Tax=Glossina brevipalpis TaxID=37001 RepID=A0A1A9VZ80_9MUSC